MPFEDGKPDLAIPGGGHFEDEEPTSSLWRRLVADPALSLLKGAVGVPEAAVGLADIATGGYAGKGAEAVGFRPKEAKEYLDTLLSPEQQEANRRVQETKGFFPTIGAAIQNPSTIAHSVLESLPSVGAGGVLARGAMAAAPKLAPLVAGAMGEGAVSAGSTAEQIRQQTPTGTLSLPQAALAAGSGAATMGFGVAGGKLAHRLGIADIDTLIAGGKLPEEAKKSLARRIGEGIFIEGPIEELPQSVQEQIAQNLALGKPVMEGVPEAGAMGMLAGSVMGGGVAAMPTKAPTKEILDRNSDPRAAAEELLQKATEDVIQGTDTLTAGQNLSDTTPKAGSILPDQPETPNDQPQLNPVPSEQAAPETATQAPAEAEAVIPEPGTIAPKTVGGIPVSAQSDERLQAIEQNPDANLNSRRAAREARRARTKNPEARPAPPEVESPILETPKGAESSVPGVATGQEGGLPETFGAKYAENGDTLRIREGIPGAGTGTVQLLDRHGEGAQAFVRLPNGAEVSANLGNYELVASPERAAQIRAKFPQDFSAPAETAQPAEIQPAPAASKTTKRIAEIDAELAKLQAQYEKKSAGGSRTGMVPPAIKVSALKSITQKMDRLDAERAALATPATQPSPAVPKPQPEAAPPVEPVKAPTGPVKTPVPDHIADAGKMVERFQGQYKKGMGITPARAAQKRLTAERPELTWTVEKSTIPEFPDRFDVVGRKPAESPAQPAVPAQPAAEKAATNKESLPVAPEAAVKEPWQYTRREFDAKGLGAVSEETLTRAQELNRKVDAAAKAMLDASGYWKHNKKGDLATRRSTIGALMEFEPHSVETALKSPKVARSLKDAYRTAKAEKDALSQSADIEASHETAVRNALAAGKPVPASVLADYPDLKQPEPAKAPVTQKAPEAKPVEAAKESAEPAKSAAEVAYNEAKAKLDALGPEPRKPSPESRAFGENSREGASPDMVARYDAEVKAYGAWRRKYSALKKAEVEASNVLFREQHPTEAAAPETPAQSAPTIAEMSPADLLRAAADKMDSEAAAANKPIPATAGEFGGGERKTYWRIQHMADPISSDWRSQIGLDEDNLGTEDGTSAFDSFEKLQRWAIGGHADWIGDLAIIEFEGDLVGKGTDGESIVIPSNELRRIPLTGGRGDQRVSIALPSIQIPGVSSPVSPPATPAPESAAKRSETTTPPVLSEKEGSIPDKNEGDADKGTALFERSNEQATPWYYSALARGLESANIKAAPAAAWVQYIKGLVNKGTAKQDEVEWTGINDWLTMQTGKVTKEQVSAFMEQGGVKVTETMLGEDLPQKRLQAAHDALIDHLVANENFTRNGARDYALDAARGDLSEGQLKLQSPESKRLSEVLQETYAARTTAPDIPVTKFEQYQLPGSIPGSYRELVLTLPEPATRTEEGRASWIEFAKPLGYSENDARLVWHSNARNTNVDFFHWEEQQARNTRGNTFESSHFPDAGNYLAHTRVNDRILPDGRKILFVEEFQSDRAQAGRKTGFRVTPERERQLRAKIAEIEAIGSNASQEQKQQWAEAMNELQPESMGSKPPQAPFVGKTDAWTSLLIKRLLRYAAEGEYDAIAWTRGDQQVERYTSALRKAVDVIEWKKTPEGVHLLGYKGVMTPNGTKRLAWLDSQSRLGRELDGDEVRELNRLRAARNKVVDTTEKESALSDAIGKSMADKIRNDPNQTGTIEGDGITVSDTGMAGYYDRIVPKVAQEVAKKVGGGKVAEIDVPLHSTDFGGEKISKQQALEITPAMREKIMGGLPLFAQGKPGGITEPTLRAEISKAFGPRAEKMVGDILIPLETQAEIANVSELADVVPLIREGDIIVGFVYRGKAYAVLENLTPEGVRGTILHELGVHYGLEGMLGEEGYAAVVRRMSVMRKAGNKAVIEAHEQAVKQAASPGQVEQETIAYLVTNRPELPFIRRLVAEIKAFLFRKFGILEDRLTPDDIATLAKASVLHASEGVRGGEAQFSRAQDQTQTEAFKKWFGASRVVDADGKPLVVYHGSDQEITEFEPGRREPGVWFTSRMETAAGYAKGNDPFMYSVYLKASRPLVVDFSSWAGKGGIKIDGIEFESNVDIVKHAQRNGYDSVNFPVGNFSEDDNTWVVFRPEQIKSAIGNTGAFDPTNPDIRFQRTNEQEGAIEAPDWVKEQPADMQETLRKAGAWRPKQTLQERFADWTADWQKKLKQGMVDQFDPIKSLDYHAYMLARMSKSSAGPLESALFDGTVFLDKDGAVDVNYEKGGFIGRMQALNGEHDRFFAWVIGNRAARLMEEGREHNFSKEDIARLKTLSRGKMADGSSREATYMKSLADLNRYNKSILDIAQKAGLIDGESRPFWEKEFYIPFYRMTEGDTTKGPVKSGGLVRQYAFKTLKGGEQAIGDPMENIIRNWAHLIDASLKNQAGVASLDAAVKAGVARETTADEKGAVFVMKNGQKTYYAVDDPFVLDAINSLGFSGFGGPAMKVMTSFKRWLTFGVTISPTFRVRNVIRDSISMIGTNPASYNVLDNVLTGWRLTKEDSPSYASMIAGGGVIRFGTLEQDGATNIKRIVASGVDAGTILDNPAKVKAMLKSAYDQWMHIGDRSENVNRAALYQKLRDEGKSHLEASYAARDTMDFSMMGTWSAIRFLAQTVPFFNARLQGLYKLGRGAAEDPRRFAYVVGATALASMALLLAYSDDDDWKQREDFDRESFWWFKIGDKAFRIPKPFEIGAIGTLAERGLEALITDDLTGKQFAQRMGSVVGQQLSMNPVPQLFMPMIEMWANKDSFTGRPIESMGMEKLSPSERISPHTSAFAQLAGKNGIVSPVQIDHIINGYFGWLGTHAVATADFALRPVMDLPAKPAMRVDDVFAVGDFVRDMPAYQSKYVTRLYEQSKEVQQVMADMRAYQKIGATEKAAEILKEQGDKIRLYRLYTHAEKQLTKINQEIKMVQRRSGDADAKRARLDQLYVQKNRVAKLTEQRAQLTRQ